MRSMHPRLTSLFLRLGLSFALLYPAVSGFFSPALWLGYFPAFLVEAAPSEGALLGVFGVFEVGLALWILSGWKVFYPGTAAGVLLLVITVFNLPQLDVLFRDISIAAAAFALALLHFPKRFTM